MSTLNLHRIYVTAHIPLGGAEANKEWFGTESLSSYVPRHNFHIMRIAFSTSSS
uniref:Aldo/keto reductase n=1 Tax=Medicago truncatula TaxID=3880 RepID=A2Q650_MEDTR|nr:Aldo/keto reductase [Medicago truncatula]